MRGRAKGMAGERLVDRLIDRLSPLGEVTARPLFGGHGLYWRETIFAILYRGRLYLKVDEESKGDYLARGMGPFRPNERQTLKSYSRCRRTSSPTGRRCCPGRGRRSGRARRRPERRRGSMLKLLRTHHVAVICSDYERSRRFYVETLGLEVVREVHRRERRLLQARPAAAGRHPDRTVLLPRAAEAAELPRGVRVATPGVRGGRHRRGRPGA